MSRRKRLTAQRAQKLHEELLRQSNAELAGVIERNIDIIELLRRHGAAARSRQERFADTMTAWSGSMAFLYAHALWFGLWVVTNLGWVPGLAPFDPFPFGLLTMIVSLEAIFLSTIVLVSQNRQAILNERQADLDLQIDLLAEYEVTRMLRLVDKMAEKMGIEDAYDAEIDQLCLPVAPDVVLREIELRQHTAG
ncbi:MAG: DUF1003 domain-containing protein [Fimbriimonadaceae bacterium]|nr:DUF1003 domain-containing protein [Fimbriimonadaceae bacterium]